MGEDAKLPRSWAKGKRELDVYAFRRNPKRRIGHTGGTLEITKEGEISRLMGFRQSAVFLMDNRDPDFGRLPAPKSPGIGTALLAYRKLVGTLSD